MPAVLVQHVSQSDAGGASSYTVTFSGTPVNGNTLFMLFGEHSTLSLTTITSITQTGVTWTNVVGVSPLHWDSEVWVGVVGAGAGKIATINFAVNSKASWAAMSEWSGIVGTPFDVSANQQTTGDPADTTLTATTAQANELWLSHYTTLGSGSMSGPNNGYTALDTPAAANGIEFGTAYKIVSATGTAGGTMAIGSSVAYLAVASAFKATAPAVAKGGNLPTLGMG